MDGQAIEEQRAAVRDLREIPGNYSRYKETILPPSMDGLSVAHRGRQMLVFWCYSEKMGV